MYTLRGLSEVGRKRLVRLAVWRGNGESGYWGWGFASGDDGGGGGRVGGFRVRIVVWERGRP